MKKKIALALSMVLMVLVLGACGKKDPSAVDYNGTSYEELQQDMQMNVGMVMSISQFYSTNGISADEVADDVRDYLINQSGAPITDIQIDATERWDEVVKEFGDAQIAAGEEIPMKSFEVTKSGKTLTTDLFIKFEKKKVDFQVVYDYYSMEITGISIEPVYTLGEKMQKAGINTLLSISVVFAVLILISLLIACFKIFPYLEQKKKQNGTNAAVPEQKTPAPAVEAKAAARTDDGELIAVIAAAIAAGTGTSTNEFVVRSIKRR